MVTYDYDAFYGDFALLVEVFRFIIVQFSAPALHIFLKYLPILSCAPKILKTGAEGTAAFFLVGTVRITVAVVRATATAADAAYGGSSELLVLVLFRFVAHRRAARIPWVLPFVMLLVGVSIEAFGVWTVLFYLGLSL